MIKLNNLPKVNVREYAKLNNLSIREVCEIYALERSFGQPRIIRAIEFNICNHDLSKVIISKFCGNYYLYEPNMLQGLTTVGRKLASAYGLQYPTLLKLYSEVRPLYIDYLAEVKREVIFEALIIDYILKNRPIKNGILKLIVGKDYKETFLEEGLCFSEMLKILK